MNGTRIVATMMLLASFFWATADAIGQAGKELIGSWTLVSVVVDQAGKKIEPFGSQPKGSIMFDPYGRFSLIITRSDLPARVSRKRQSGTAEETRAIIQGSIAYFDTYTVSDDDRTFIVHVEGSTFPNWVGADRKRIFSISGDELKSTNSDRSGGAGTALVIWKRAK